VQRIRGPYPGWRPGIQRLLRSAGRLDRAPVWPSTGAFLSPRTRSGCLRQLSSCAGHDMLVHDMPTRTLRDFWNGRGTVANVSRGMRAFRCTFRPDVGRTPSARMCTPPGHRHVWRMRQTGQVRLRSSLPERRDCPPSVRLRACRVPPRPRLRSVSLFRPTSAGRLPRSAGVDRGPARRALASTAASPPFHPLPPLSPPLLCLPSARGSARGAPSCRHRPQGDSTPFHPASAVVSAGVLPRFRPVKRALRGRAMRRAAAPSAVGAAAEPDAPPPPPPRPPSPNAPPRTATAHRHRTEIPLGGALVRGGRGRGAAGRGRRIATEREGRAGSQAAAGARAHTRGINQRASTTTNDRDGGQRADEQDGSRTRTRIQMRTPTARTRRTRRRRRELGV